MTFDPVLILLKLNLGLRKYDRCVDMCICGPSVYYIVETLVDDDCIIMSGIGISLGGLRTWKPRFATPPFLSTQSLNKDPYLASPSTEITESCSHLLRLH